MIKVFDNSNNGTDIPADKKIDTWLIMTDGTDGTNGKLMTGYGAGYIGYSAGYGKNSKTIAGKIIARYARTLTVLSITFFETDSTPDVGTMEIMDGCSNDITAYGIGSLLWRLREDLAKWHGIKFACRETEMISRWKQELEQNGYVVIKKTHQDETEQIINS